MPGRWESCWLPGHGREGREAATRLQAVLAKTSGRLQQSRSRRPCSKLPSVWHTSAWRPGFIGLENHAHFGFHRGAHRSLLMLNVQGKPGHAVAGSWETGFYDTMLFQGPAGVLSLQVWPLTASACSDYCFVPIRGCSTALTGIAAALTVAHGSEPCGDQILMSARRTPGRMGRPRLPLPHLLMSMPNSGRC
jgi:hypothetical protein